MRLEKDPSLKKPQKLFFVLFGLLFLIAPFYYQPNMGGEGLFLPYNSSIWIVACWILAAASFVIYRTNSLILPKHWFGLSMLPAGAILTGLVAENNNPSEWLVRLSVIIGGYFVMISLYQFRLTSRHLERSLYILLLFLIITGIYGVIQTQPHANLRDIMPYSPNGVMVGIFQQVNLQASAMATLLVLVFFLISRPAVRSMGIAVKLALLLGALIAAFSITQIGSRVGLLGAITGLLLLLIGRWQVLKYANRALVFAVIFSTLAGGFLGASGLVATANKFDRAMGGMQVDVRWQIYSLSWQIFKEEPILGHGLGSFQKVFQVRRGELTDSPENEKLKESPRYSHPHNELIFWMIEGGIVSIIGILAATVVTLRQLWETGFQRGFGYAAFLVPIILHTQVELPFYISNTHWFLLIVLLFIIHQHGKITISLAKTSLTAQKAVPVFFTSLAITISIFLSHAQISNAGIIKYLQSKQRIPHYLTPAVSNPYFNDLASRMLLIREMHIKASQSDFSATERFLRWAETRVVLIPDIGLYIQMAMAFNYLNKPEERDKVLATASSIYKGHRGLEKYKKSIADQAGISSSALPKSLTQPPASQPQSD